LKDTWSNSRRRTNGGEET